MMLRTAALRMRDSNKDSGAVALEFALLSPILVMILLLTIEFGFVMQAQLELVHVAEEGARLASVSTTWTADAVKARAPRLNASGHLNVTKTDNGDGSVTVRATYDLPDGGKAVPHFIMPYLGTNSYGLPGVTLRSSATMHKEY